MEPNVLLLPSQNRCRSIESFTKSECWNYFETRKQDLYRLRKALLLDGFCILSNGIKMPGEEVLLRGLYELVSGDDQFVISNEIFGRDQPAQSRAFRFFIDHIYSHFQDILTDNLEWWFQNGYFMQSMLAIKEKFGNAGFNTIGNIIPI